MFLYKQQSPDKTTEARCHHTAKISLKTGRQIRTQIYKKSLNILLRLLKKIFQFGYGAIPLMNDSTPVLVGVKVFNGFASMSHLTFNLKL